MCCCVAENYKQLSQKYAGARCTLDGKDAIISGILKKFGQVSTLDGKQSYEWCWTSIDAIMRNDEKFFS
jgi:hypothetical protein